MATAGLLTEAAPVKATGPEVVALEAAVVREALPVA